ncbi:hypothetical protein BUE93_09675 [Chromobacterium amazonense]|uniref:Uncharacterized protein n=2 Tax=Chromobacterium amazonense TaxID=1382803 RepID=A0A2S9X5B5_9NEIS|nr:hypothetical protein BUE93_09675 [Chromobacterium amazonense]
MLKNSRKWVDVLFMKKGLLERPVFLIFLSIVVGVISGLIGNGATEIFKEVGLKGVGWALLLLVIFLSIPIFMGMFFSVVFDGKYDRSYELSLLLQRIEELNGCEIIQ